MSENRKSIIDLQGISKTFGANEALQNISYSVEEGTVFALLGENGAGKTTTIRILLGLEQPDSGKVEVLGMDPKKEDLKIRKKVGYVPELPALYEWMSVEEIGRFAAVFYPDGYWPEYCRLIESFSLPMKTKIRALSKGMKGEVSLSLALASDPPLLILDEPTSGLDAMIRRRFLESMVDRAAMGKTVFLSSHQIVEVERVADIIAIMKKSRILLVEPLDQLKATSRIYTITFDGDPGSFSAPEPVFEKIVEQRTEGREVQIFGRDPVSNAADLLRNIQGAVHVDEKIPTLEEIFMGYMRSEEP
ncbi:MAG: ABC transporter ATP-binding protein [Planctomycetia bacterium]|nr:ABC transporter ATP-binding protein [Planctomycetia bacterium]